MENFNIVDNNDYRLTDSAAILRCIHAGKGTLALVNAESLKHHTYYFSSPSDPDEFEPGTIFVYCKHESGGRNYVGKLDKDRVRLTRRSNYGVHTEAVKGANYIVKMANDPIKAADGRMMLYTEGRCCMCGRPLTESKSLHRGIGKKCLKIYNEKVSKINDNRKLDEVQ